MITRRLLLAMFALPGAPTDEGRLNEFARVYNAYVMRLKDGVVDLKLWERVERAWKRLSG